MKYLCCIRGHTNASKIFFFKQLINNDKYLSVVLNILCVFANYVHLSLDQMGLHSSIC